MTWDPKEAVWAAVIKAFNPNTLAEDTLYVADRNAFVVGSNLVTSPDVVTAGGGWTMGGSAVGTAAISTVEGVPLTRITNAATGNVQRAVTLTGDGVKRFGAIVQFDGVAGVSGHGLFDSTASAFLALADVTWLADGTATAVAVSGTILQFTALGDNAYHLVMSSASATAAHTNQAFASWAGGGVTSIRIGRVTVEDAGALAETQFSILLEQPVLASRTAFGDHTSQGRGRVAVGSVMLNNAFGALDQYRTYGFDGRAITIYLGQTGDVFPSDFVVAMDATMVSATFTQEDVAIKLRDWQRAANVPLQTTVYAGSNVLPAGLEGVADLKGKPKPVCIGEPRNAEPVLVNSSKLIYQINDGAISTLANVYDKGISLNVGESWLSRTSPFSGTANVSGITFASGLYVAVANDPLAKIATSPDGVTWTLRTLPGTPGFANQVAFGAGLYVAVGQEIYSSPTGVTWTRRTAPNDGTDSSVAFIDFLALFVAVATSGAIQTSPDGITWTTRTSPFITTGAGFSIAAGNGLVVIVGDHGQTASSLDGVTFVLRTIDFSDAQFSALAYSATLKLFVAAGVDPGTSIGGPGTSAISEDGISWTRVDGFLGQAPVTSLAFGLGHFAAVAESNNNYGTSNDGRNWVTRIGAASPFGSTAMFAICFDGSHFVAGGAGGKIFQTNSTTTLYTNTTDLENDALAPGAGTYGAYLAGGYIRFGSQPAGRVTCDPVQVDVTAGDQFTTVLQRAGYVTGDWNAADITALDATNSAVLGYYTADTTSCADVLDQIAQSVGAWWSTDKSGVIRIQQLTDPSPNLVANPDTITAAAGWTMGGTTAGSAAFSHVGIVPLTRITSAATGNVQRAVVLASAGLKRFSCIVQFDGNAGVSGHGLFDATASSFLALGSVTWASDGSATAVATNGTLVRFTALGGNAYRLVLTSTAATLAHTNQAFASWSGGGVTSVRVGRVTVLEVLPTAAIPQTDMDGMVQVPSADPNDGIATPRSVVRYSKNFAVLSNTDLADGVSDADRAIFTADFLDAGTTLDATVQAAHPLAVQRTDESLLTTLSDANAEATRRQALYGAQRYWFDVPMFLTADYAAIELGDVIELVTERYGFGGGGLACVLGVRPNAAGGRLLLSVWC